MQIYTKLDASLLDPIQTLMYSFLKSVNGFSMKSMSFNAYRPISYLSWYLRSPKSWGMAVSHVNFKSSNAICLRYWKFIEVSVSGRFLELYTSLNESWNYIGKWLYTRSLLMSLNVSLLLNCLIGMTTSVVPGSTNRYERCLILGVHCWYLL